MAHHIYHTEAFVLEGRNIGEANKYFYLFTRELGMIEATAQAVREGKSKLRPALMDFSLSTVSLVRGKNGWKITNAVCSENFYELLRTNLQSLLVVGHVFALLKRLLNGEEKDENLYDMISNAFRLLLDPSLTKEDIINTECVLVLSILHCLGYVDKNNDFDPVISQAVIPNAWNKDLLHLVGPLRERALLEINRSLKESQL